MKREWWLADWLPSAMLGVGASLASAFGPTLITTRPWQVGLFVAGGALLVARPLFLNWRTRRKAGSAVLVYAALPDFTPGWEARARNFSGRRYLEVLPYRRTLPADAGEWKVPVRDVTNHVQYLFESPDDWGFDSRDPSLFISAPWPVAWAMASRFQHYASWSVYQEHSDRSGFFKGATVRRDRKVAVEAASCTLISEQVHELGAPTATSALVLKLGSHDLVASSLHSAASQGVGRALVVHEKYPIPGLLEETAENFERLVLEVFGAVKRFIDGRRATAGGQHTFVVYATMPIAVAFALGAYLGFGTDFRLMHWDQGARAYVPAEIGGRP